MSDVALLLLALGGACLIGAIPGHIAMWRLRRQAARELAAFEALTRDQQHDWYIAGLASFNSMTNKYTPHRFRR